MHLYSKIGYTFVGIWEKGLPGVPLFDDKFARDLFGDPYTTNKVMTTEGVAITKPSPIPGIAAPAVVVGTQKFQVGNHELDQLCKSAEKVLNKLKEADKDVILGFQGYGLNIEYSVDLKEQASEWMAGKFLGPFVQEGQKTHGKDVQFEINYPDGVKFIVMVQPRFNDPKSVFILVNYHNPGTLTFEKGDFDLTKHFERADREITNKIFKPLAL